MSDYSFLAVDLAATDRLGSALATVLPGTATVALTGTLGAGKTRLVQAVASAWGIAPRDVVSPTFVLCHQYRGQRLIYHFDAYRLRDEDEFLELGPDEYFEAEAVSFVEWADRVAGCLPRDYLAVDIEVAGAEARWFHFRSHGPRMATVLDDLRRQLAP